MCGHRTSCPGVQPRPSNLRFETLFKFEIAPGNCAASEKCGERVVSKEDWPSRLKVRGNACLPACLPVQGDKSSQVLSRLVGLCTGLLDGRVTTRFARRGMDRVADRSATVIGSRHGGAVRQIDDATLFTPRQQRHRTGIFGIEEDPNSLADVKRRKDTEFLEAIRQQMESQRMRRQLERHPFDAPATRAPGHAPGHAPLRTVIAHLATAEPTTLTMGQASLAGLRAAANAPVLSLDYIAHLRRLCGSELDVVAFVARRFGLPPEAIAHQVHAWLGCLPTIPPPSRQQSAPSLLSPAVQRHHSCSTSHAPEMLPLKTPPASAPVHGGGLLPRSGSDSALVAAMRSLDTRLNASTRPTSRGRRAAGAHDEPQRAEFGIDLLSAGMPALPPPVPEESALESAPHDEALHAFMERAKQRDARIVPMGAGTRERGSCRSSWMTRRVRT